MKKMTLADKLAKKSFMSEKFQQSWSGHMQAFGPILEPAFAEDYQSLTHLCAALNLISNRKLEQALKKLQLLQKRCETDADKAAWLFCMGLVFDMAGVKDAMVDFYQQAAAVGHRFYLPYLKVAKAAHMDGAFDVAAQNYEMGISCLAEMKQEGQVPMILASAYSNYASVLTMMHRFEEAHSALDASMDAMPVLPGRSGTHGVLFAAEGNWTVADAAMEALKSETPMLFEQTEKVVEEIRKGKHPQFFVQEINEEDLAAFWAWFVENEGAVAGCLAANAYTEAFGLVQPQLRALFPFMERDLDSAFQPVEEGIRLIFADYYAVGLRDGYEKLIAACPADLENPWIFEIEH